MGGRVTAFGDRLRANLAAAGLSVEGERGAEPAHSFDADLIPEVTESVHGPDELSTILDGMSILDAYTKWCGKSVPDAGGKTESIMVSCPKPDHPDRVPSAWLNSEKGTWFCGGCNVGGDAYDIAAYHFGMPVPGYKSKDQFPKLRERMATSLGVTVTRTLGGATIMTLPSPEPPVIEPLPEEAPSETPAPILRSVPDLEPTPIVAPAVAAPEYEQDKLEIPWGAIVPEGTFMHEWMMLAEMGDEPNEYLWWLGLMAVASAAGNKVVLDDNPYVRANLMVCLLGSSGSRKSRAIHRVVDLLNQALPYDKSDPDSTGTFVMDVPASGEALIDMFSKPIYDDANPSLLIGYAPVRGLVKFGEFSEFSSRSSRLGNTLKPTIMELFDSSNTISLRSRTHGEARADNHFGQVVSSTQPRAIREHVTRADVDSGFVNRWIFAPAVSKPRVALSTGAPDIAVCVDRLSSLRGWSSERVVRLEDKARRRVIEIIEDQIFPHLDTETSAVMERLDLVFKKLVLLMAINERASRIYTEDLVDRAALVLPYLFHTYEVTDANIGFGPFQDCCDAIELAIIELTRKAGKPPKREQIRKLVPKRFDHGLMSKAMKALMEVGLVNEQIVGEAKEVRYSALKA